MREPIEAVYKRYSYSEEQISLLCVKVGTSARMKLCLEKSRGKNVRSSDRTQQFYSPRRIIVCSIELRFKWFNGSVKRQRSLGGKRSGKREREWKKSRSRRRGRKIKREMRDKCIIW